MAGDLAERMVDGNWSMSAVPEALGKGLASGGLALLGGAATKGILGNRLGSAAKRLAADEKFVSKMGTDLASSKVARTEAKSLLNREQANLNKLTSKEGDKRLFTRTKTYDAAVAKRDMARESASDANAKVAQDQSAFDVAETMRDKSGARVDLLKKWEGRSGWRKKAGPGEERAPYFKNWGNRAARGLATTPVMPVASLFDGSGEPADSGAGDPDTPGSPEALADIPVQWTGGHISQQMGGQAPFALQTPGVPNVPGVSSVGGFLPQPVGLTSVELQQWYGGDQNSLAGSIGEYWTLFGDEAAKKGLEPNQLTPCPSAASAVGGSSATAVTVGRAALALDQRAAKFTEIERAVVTAVEKAEKTTRDGRNNIVQLISGITVNVKDPSTYSGTGSIDEQFMGVVALGFDTVTEIEGLATDEHLDTAADIKALEKYLAELTAENNKRLTEDLNAALAGIQAQQNNPAYQADLGGTNTPGASGFPGSNGDQLGGMNGMPISAPADTGMAAMMGPLLSSMLGPMMNRQMADQFGMDDEERANELDRRLRAEELKPGPTAPTPWAQPVPGSPAPAAAAPNPGGPPGGDQAGPPAGSSAPDSNRVPSRTPDADGAVLYTFPDGRTQRVAAVVAQALDAAFAGKTTDAKAAYAATSAKWTDREEPGKRVDPYQLMTGDVATWDERTALVVSFGVDSGTLEVVVDGVLQPFLPEMNDATGSFGPFAGFYHPKGIDIATGASRSPVASTPWSDPAVGQPATPAATPMAIPAA
ncbi:MAG: hypothetical protein HOQ24_01970 [Mycobacteriaceae bacterium]|nr:hypothetical protein [Mycobacteriaceae bacterium]